MLARLKPEDVEARQLSLDVASNNDILTWSGGETFQMDEISGGDLFLIPTPTGQHVAAPSDWIVRRPNGDFLVVKADVFAEDYEEVTV